METQQPAFNQQELPNPRKSQNFLILATVGVGLLVVGFSLGHFNKTTLRWFSSLHQDSYTQDLDTSNGSNEPTALSQYLSDSPSGLLDFSALSESNTQAYALSRDGKLFLIPVDGANAVVTLNQEGPMSGGGAYGLGETSPLSAPDLKKTAFINSANNLEIVTSDGKKSVKLPESLKVEYITGWSSDSQKLVLYSGTKNIGDSYFNVGPVDPSTIAKQQTFEKGRWAGGFYLLDLTNSKIEYLAPLNKMNFLEWIDDTRALVSYGESLPGELFIFDTSTFTADISPLDNLFDTYSGPQFSFNKNGTKWAVTLAPTDKMNSVDSEMSVVLADFASLNGTTVDKGRFAQVQGPVISPSGDKVLYQKYDVVNDPRYVHLHSNGTSERLAEGRALQWIDDNSFIYVHHSPLNGPTEITTLFRYDISTKKVTQLHQF